MEKKPRKIKRYKRSFSGPSSHKNEIRRVITWVVVVALLFGLGWLVAKPGLDFASGLWYNYKENHNAPPASSATSEQLPASSAPADSASEPGPAESESTDSCAIVSMTAVATPEKAAETASALAAQGVKSALIMLKDESGAVYYRSAVALAQSAVADFAFDGAAVAKAFTDAGVTPVAGVWAFKDAIAPYADRTMAVKYQGTDYNWLDNSKELGGKTWLNPNSPAAQEYIGALLAEISGMGYPKTVVFGLQFPIGYSLEACDYGAMTQSKAALLTQLAKKYEATSGTEVWFCFDQDALEGTDVTAYGESPAGFGLDRILVRGRTTSAPGTDGEQTTTLPATDTAALGRLLETMRGAGTEKAGYYLLGASAEQTAAANENAVSAGYAAVVEYS